MKPGGRAVGQVRRCGLTKHECLTCSCSRHQVRWQKPHQHALGGIPSLLHHSPLVQSLLLRPKQPTIGMGRFVGLSQEADAIDASRIIILNKCSNLCICVSVCDIAWFAFCPEMVDRARPSPFFDFLDAHMRIDDVLPECFQILCIGHHCSNTDDCNGFKRTLFESFAWFSVIGCDGHVFTSYVHDALWHHGDGIACIDMDALPCYACRSGLASHKVVPATSF